MNKKINILIACHKPDQVYQDDVYIPIHVGRAVSKFKDEMSFMIGDDTGDNISNKNPYYCELTAQYWAWKNIDSEYIGLCHYRRYFETRFSIGNIDSLLGANYDMILAQPFFGRNNICTRLKLATCAEDFYIFYQCLVRLYPEYKSCVDKYIRGNKIVPYNMFVMKKDLFAKFAEFQFSILEEMERYVKLSGYTRCRRLYGYFAEILLQVYAIENNLRCRYESIVSMVGNKYEGKTKLHLKNVYNRIMFRIWPDKLRLEFDALKVGLRNDGIIF